MIARIPHHNGIRRAVFFAAAALAGPSAHAASVGPVAIDLDAALVSDYRFRGVSRSDRDPAAQAGATVGYRQLFVSAFASSVADWHGADAEVDLSAGWSGDAGPVTATVGVIGYVFPGGRGSGYVEAFGSVAKTIGPAEITFGANYAPDLANLDGGNLYLVVAARAGIPTTGLTAKVSLGHERGPLARAIAGSPKTSYAVGIEYNRRPFTLGLGYIGTDVARSAPGRRLARGGVVASATVRF